MIALGSKEIEQAIKWIAANKRRDVVTFGGELWAVSGDDVIRTTEVCIPCSECGGQGEVYGRYDLIVCPHCHGSEVEWFTPDVDWILDSIAEAEQRAEVAA